MYLRPTQIKNINKDDTSFHYFVNIFGTVCPIEIKFNRVLGEPETHKLELVSLKSVQPTLRKSSELHTPEPTHTDIFRSRHAESIGIWHLTLRATDRKG